MDGFECHGWLQITVLKGSKMVSIKLKHEDDHVPYRSIDVPPKVKDYVAKNPELRAIQIWKWILQLPEYQVTKPNFSRRAIYQLRLKGDKAKCDTTSLAGDIDRYKSSEQSYDTTRALGGHRETKRRRLNTMGHTPNSVS
ncbi:hypothetical protein DL96DRAFT_1617044 [Flagelloscypha sp. PMI_526]|nr:hypothetical protein DL96DRAFT_1617044 [Flagelloscypha sp. PMI_526]